MLSKIKRASLRKYSREEIDQLVQDELDHILSITSPLRVLLFGSALTPEFDDWSDLDFVLVYKDKTESQKAQKKLYRYRAKRERKADYLCTDQETFANKSKFGGVFYIARIEGKDLL